MPEQPTARPPNPAAPNAWQRFLTAPIIIVGDLSVFFAQSIAAIFRRPYRISLFFIHLDFMAYGSLFVVALTGLFTGMVLALQTVYAFGLFNAQSLVGATVELTLARELAPIFTCIVLVARVGSAVATELGTMRVTEQIDALETMAVDPINYLVVPRILAAAVASPLLTMLFNAVALAGAYLIAVVVKDLSPGTFLNRLETLVELKDLTDGLGKSIVIGFVVVLISAYRGYRAEGGARGVGIATTQAVVGGLVAIFAIDYVYTAITLANPTPRGGLGG
ncbi:MAG TPA: ABC transporter permease [Myxococcales bacterium]|jgi:phospholipid/cholesterol/gamma-HCH transport system permease protein|nr:ABC transporter permease [Myxococcales bacterium]